MSDKAEEIIPNQEEGAQSNTQASADFTSVEEAVSFYELVKQRLLAVNEWHSIAGPLTATFQLTDASGDEVSRTPQIGDHFKIDIPGPGPITGDGFDWVQIEEIEEAQEGDTELASIRVRPATNPKNARHDVAHFFSDAATSCFLVERKGTTVTAGVYGRNEKPNTDAEKLADKARNAAVATGAVTAFSKLQWKSLVNGLVKKD
jgi:hypothetical protein